VVARRRIPAATWPDFAPENLDGLGGAPFLGIWVAGLEE
jgi:hypothetical protein